MTRSKPRGRCIDTKRSTKTTGRSEQILNLLCFGVMLGASLGMAITETHLIDRLMFAIMALIFAIPFFLEVYLGRTNHTS